MFLQSLLLPRNLLLTTTIFKNIKGLSSIDIQITEALLAGCRVVML